MKVFRAWVAASQLVLCAAGDCSDLVGSCATKHASLMQFKSLSQKKQSLALDSTESVSSRLAAFQKFTDEMIAKYEQTPDQEAQAQQVDQQTLDAVFMVLKYIEGMHQLLSDAHDDDVELAEAQASIYQHCIDSNMPEEVVAEILARQEADVLAGQAHQQCLGNARTPCREKCLANGPCEEYDSWRMSPKGELPGCVTKKQNQPDDLTEAAFANSFIRAEEDSKKLQIMEECLEDTKKWLDPLYSRYEACERVGDDCENNVTECDKLQHHFQQKRCLFAAESDARCGLVTNCFSTSSTDCPDECDKIKIRAAARAADNETGQRLICLLHNLFGKPKPDSTEANVQFEPRPSKEERTAGLEACKREEIVVEGWSIPCECPEVPPPNMNMNGYTCPQGGVARPCTDTFIEENAWTTRLLTIPETCDEKAARGSNGVVDLSICETDACPAL